MTHSQYAVVESSTAFKFFPATTNKPIAPRPHTANKTIAHNQFLPVITATGLVWSKNTILSANTTDAPTVPKTKFQNPRISEGTSPL